MSQETLLTLMRLVGDEVHALALEIAELGDLLSGGGGAVASLQAFDALSQRAFAQARLLGGLEQALRNPDADWRLRVDALIAAVPFHADRARLRAALHPAENADAAVAMGGGIEWF